MQSCLWKLNSHMQRWHWTTESYTRASFRISISRYSNSRSYVWRRQMRQRKSFLNYAWNWRSGGENLRSLPHQAKPMRQAGVWSFEASKRDASLMKGFVLGLKWKRMVILKHFCLQRSLDDCHREFRFAWSVCGCLTFV